MFTDYESVAQIAPGGNFFDTSTRSTATTRCCRRSKHDDRLRLQRHDRRSAGIGDPTCPLYIGRRNVEGGGRQQEFHNTSFRGLIGSRGEIAEGWDYDVSDAVLARHRRSVAR